MQFMKKVFHVQGTIRENFYLLSDTGNPALKGLSKTGAVFPVCLYLPDINLNIMI